MRKSGLVLAAALLATALCADRGFASAAAERPQMVDAAIRLAHRLRGGLRRAAAPDRFHPFRRADALRVVGVILSWPQAVVCRPMLSPFQFRLPPPVC